MGQKIAEKFEVQSLETSQGVGVLVLFRVLIQDCRSSLGSLWQRLDR